MVAQLGAGLAVRHMRTRSSVVMDKAFRLINPDEFLVHFFLAVRGALNSQ